MNAPRTRFFREVTVGCVGSRTILDAKKDGAPPLRDGFAGVEAIGCKCRLGDCFAALPVVLGVARTRPVPALRASGTRTVPVFFREMPLRISAGVFLSGCPPAPLLLTPLGSAVSGMTPLLFAESGFGE